VRVELGLGAEQFGAAGSAGVGADGLGVDVLTGPRPFGAGLAQDGVLLRRELRAPLLVGLDDLGLMGGCGHASTVRPRRRPDRTTPGPDTDVFVLLSAL
jgi:hypothetical protein